LASRPSAARAVELFAKAVTRSVSGGSDGEAQLKAATCNRIC
jgi:hypothetical protein